MTATIERVERDAAPAPNGAAPPVRASRSIVAAALGIVAVLLLALVLNLVLVSRLTHRSAQQAGFKTLRAQLAQGTAPVSQLDSNGRLLESGAPIALLNIPQIGLTNEVIFNGTTSGVLTKGPGHQRNTVLPGQVGESIVFGRSGAYGGPFGELEKLHKGDTFTVTTGQGLARYQVIGTRLAGDPSPALQAGHGLLTLTTGRGRPFMPSGVLRVDAALISTPQPAAGLYAIPMSSAEQPMGTEHGALLPLVLWLQSVLVVALGAVLAWHRWGRWQTWVVFGPLALFAGYFTANQISLLLPNLS